ncbi:MAG: hypothetical protein KY468_13875 [Armatimonadetes bacterium]|nr:hypothetical protein [Armatimonadota bacterium]
MSDEHDIIPAYKRREEQPRFRIEADTLDELVQKLQDLVPDLDALEFLARKEEKPKPIEEVPQPEPVQHKDLRQVAEELTERLQNTPSRPEEELPPLDQSQWQPYRRSERGAVLRRLHRRRARSMETEPGYLWLYDAMMARELEDRNEAVKQLERVGDAARLERLAEHSFHRITRRAALDALSRLGAVPALESAALYVRPEIYTPQKPKTSGEEEGATTRKNIPVPHDDTRDHAVDLLAQLSDQGREDALEALLRIIRYDFSPDSSARIRALRRLGERLDRLEARKDWNALALLYRESRNATVHREVTARLAKHIEELEEEGAVDALLAVADLLPDHRARAEEAVHRIESSDH